MKKIKLLALVLVLAMVCSVFVGCKGKKQDVSNSDALTYWVTIPLASQRTHTSFNDMMMYKEICKATGVDVEFIHPSSGTEFTEGFQILLASSEYPDIIEYDWSSYVGGPDQAINDNVIISLNDYLEEYAPNYYDCMEGERGKEVDYKYKADAISFDGNYYGFKALNIGSYRGYAGLYVRKDMLDKWNLDVPETIDEWDVVFETAKKNGVDVPLTGLISLFGISSGPAFNSAWDVGKGLYVDKGTVKFGPFESAYKDYVTKMAEWFKKGYVDIDYVTNANENVHSYMTNGKSVAAWGYVGGDLGALLPAMIDRNPNYNLAACPFPVMNKGDIPKFQPVQQRADEPCAAISVQCGEKNKDRYIDAIKWCDYMYSEEGLVLKCFGVEGETFTFGKDEKGVERYLYTNKIKEPKEIKGATTVADALFYYMRPANAPGFNQHPDYFNGFYPYDQQKEAIETWNKYAEIADAYSLPYTLPFTADESSEIAEIKAKCDMNLDAAVSNILLGRASADTYDKAISDAKKGGYDKLIEIYQDAYDRYISRIE